ncbi:hypothetical protein ACFQPA_16140 [Halomarina halobia]|uniref:Uncharacterized protein n=1 Tax=Halomarina halobia TaxID=3033386 RepID=A0ABD6AEG6_9EURY|nr:hypothetical protein [Halomarina sp. PSR21]
MSLGLLLFIGVSTVPGVVSAHGGEHTPGIPQWYGLVVLLLGFGVLGASVALNRRDRLARTEHALAGVFLGVVIAALGGILIVQLSPINELSGNTMPFSRTLYLPLALGVGLAIITASVFLGQLRWPTRPRYAILGGLLGLWVAYPALVRGLAVYHHPIGYMIALAVPLTVGYIIRRDGQDVLREVARDPVARRFGFGVGFVMVIFFIFSTGLLSFVPEEGIINGETTIHTPAFVDTVPTANPLVVWPAVQFWFPQIPLSGMLSVGTLLIVGLLGALVSMNAMLAAYQWLRVKRTSSTQSAAGAAALVGPNTCGCCGPMFAQLAVVLIGPSAAAPLYWLFVDFSSPVGAFFFVGSVALLTGGFVYSANALAPDLCSISADEHSHGTEQIRSSN